MRCAQRTRYQVSKYILPKLLVNTKENESTVTLHLFDRRNLLQRKAEIQGIRHLQPKLLLQMVCLMVTLGLKMDRLLDLKMEMDKLMLLKERLRLEGETLIEIKPLIRLHQFEPVQVPDLDLAKNEIL